MPDTPTTFWKQKLAAFLHDPPHKQFGLQFHEDTRGPILHHVGLSVEDMWQWWKSPDWQASAADRYSFPEANRLLVDWKTDGHLQFHHTLSGTRFTPSQQPRENSDIGEKWLEDALHGLSFEAAYEGARLFRLWRFWAERSAREKNDLLAYPHTLERSESGKLPSAACLISYFPFTGPTPHFLPLTPTLT